MRHLHDALDVLAIALREADSHLNSADCSRQSVNRAHGASEARGRVQVALRWFEAHRSVEARLASELDKVATALAELHDDADPSCAWCADNASALVEAHYEYLTATEQSAP